MKPSRKLLSSVIFFTMSSPLLHGAADIVIKNTADVDITAGPTFQDLTNNGGASNLTSFTLQGALLSSNVTVTTNTVGLAPNGGQIKIEDSVAWSSTSNLALFANSNTVINATVTSIGGGNLNLTSGTTVAFDSDVTLMGSPAQLTVQSGGITQGVLIRKLLISGLADLGAGSGDITLNSANNFGSLKLTGAGVTVNEASSSLLTGVAATTLTLTSAGMIEDTPGAAIGVAGLATLNAGVNAITLGDNAVGNTNFGSLNLTGTVITIKEDSETELAGVTGATSLTLTSSGAITDTGNISVSGLATINSNGNAITLGGAETTNFGTLNISGGAVSISEDSGMNLVGVNTATSVLLTAAGDLTDAAATSVVVTGLASFSGNSISLGGGTFNSGTLTFNSMGAVNIAEDSGIDIVGSNTGGTTHLTAVNGISDLNVSSVNVGALTLNGTSISLGGGTFNATTLNFNSGGAVSIQEDSSSLLVGTNSGSSLLLTSTAALANDASASLVVNGNASFGGSSIVLGTGMFDTLQLGSLTFNSTGIVAIQENDATTLTGASTGGSLTLTSGGAITDNAGSLTVTGNVNLTAASATSITLDDTVFNVGGNTLFNASSGQNIIANQTTNVFTGDVTFTAVSGTLANVSIFDTTSLNLQASLTLSNSLTATSGATLTDNGDLSVAGLATLRGNTISIGGATKTTNFDSLNFNSSGAVTIQEDSSTLLTGINTAGGLTLSSLAGITNSATASLTVMNNASLVGSSITLGNVMGDTINLGSLTFDSTGAVIIHENSSTLLSGSSQASSLELKSTQGITNGANAEMQVTNNANFAGASISLGAAANDLMNFGSLSFTSAGDVVIQENSSTHLLGANTGLSLALTSTGDLTNAESASLIVSNNANLSGTTIMLGTASGDLINLGSLTFNSIGAVTIEENDSTLLTGSNAVATLALTSGGAITDTLGTSLTVTNAASIVAGLGTAIVLDDTTFNIEGNTVFTAGGGQDIIANKTTNSFGGTVTFMASAGTLASVDLFDTSAFDIQALTLTGNLTVRSNAALTDSGNVSAAGLATLVGSSITLGGDTENTNYGSLNFNSTGAVVIQEDSSTLLTGGNSAGSLALTSAADITNHPTGSLIVTNHANFAGTSITLGSLVTDTMNFGSLTFNSAGAVTIHEDSATLLSGTSTASNLVLSSTEGVTNDGATNLTVRNNAKISGATISLGNVAGDVVNFGSLTFSSNGIVTIQEDSATLLSGASSGSSLALSSTGDISNDASADLAILNNANFGGTSISLGAVVGDKMNFGSLTFNSMGAVAIQEDSATDLIGQSTALSLALQSTGALTNDATARLTVTNNANLSGASISLGTVVNDAMNFGTLTFNSLGAVAIEEDSATQLTGSNSASTLALSSGGGITDTMGSSLTVGGVAGISSSASINLTNTSLNVGSDTTFTAGNGADIIANNTANVLNGTVTFVASAGTLANVDIFDTTALDLKPLTLTGNLIARSNAALTDSGNVSIAGLATLVGSTITIGGATEMTGFGTLNFNSTGAVTIQEDSSTSLVGTSTAASLSLASAGALIDGGNLTVTGLASFSGTSIMIGGASQTTHFDSLTVSSAGAVGVQEDSDTQFVGTNSASTLTLTSSGVSTFTVGSTLNAAILDLQTQSVVLTGNNLVDSLEVRLSNGTTLTTNGNDTIGALISNGGTLNGSATLMAAGGATLNGSSIVSGNLLGNTVSTGEVLVSGAIGGGSLSVTGGVLTLTGSSTNTPVEISLNAALTDSSGGLSAAAAVINAGLLTVSSADTVTSYTQNGTGTLAGAAALTATGGAILNGGTISGNLLANTTSTGAVLVSGTVGGGSLSVTSGLLTLTGTSTNTPVSISLNAALLDSSGGLDAAAAVTNAGLLTVNSADTVTTYTQNGTGTLAGSAALTTTGGATLNGGTVSGELQGNTTSTGAVLVFGKLAGGSLAVTAGSLTLSGTSTNTPIDISSGAELTDVNGGLDAAAVVTNAGLLTVNSAETVTTYTQNGAGRLAGSAALTTTGGAVLNGGSVSGNLQGNTTSTGAVLVSGNLGGGSLSVTGGSLNLTGTSTNSPVAISEGAALTDANGGLDSAATVTNAGLLTINSADSVMTYTQNGIGILAGTAALTATGGATLNGGTVSGNLRGDTTSTGMVLVSGTVGGGSLSVTGGSLNLTGTSTNTPVSISSGAALTDSNGGLATTAAVTNAGLLTVNTADMVMTYTQNGTGTLTGPAALTTTDGADLNGGTVSGNLQGNTTSTGSVLVSGMLGGGSLSVTGGIMTLTGSSMNTPLGISSGATLVDSSGGLNSATIVTNAGTFTVNANETVSTYTQNGSGILNGSAILTATNGATLTGGTVAGKLLGNTTSTGDVLISGTMGGGTLSVTGGILTLTGTANANTTVDVGATLKGAGIINGNVVNHGTTALSLTISGSLVTTGFVTMSFNSPTNFDRIKAASVSLGGGLIVTNTGVGLANGETAKIIDAASYTGAFTAFSSVDFDNGLLFNDRTGMLIGLAGGQAHAGGRYLNLTENQTNTYLGLFENAVQPGVKNVSRSGDVITFTSGASNGEAQLVTALNESTFGTPGVINSTIMNGLSPEVFAGMADYTEQALRTHVREAADAAPSARKGKTQVFATLHSTTAGVDDSSNNAAYDVEFAGVTTGMRYDVDGNFQIGGLLGVDDGSITGTLIDTDAQGLALGAFGSYQFKDRFQTMILGSLSYGNYSYDTTRQSYGGETRADGIGSGAVELALGVSSVVYEKNGLQISPTGGFRYMAGTVDRFEEDGAGVRLAADEQDIDSFLLDVGVDFAYQVNEKFSVAGRLGYIHDVSDSDRDVTATFASVGPGAESFTVTGPGIDNQGITLGLGLYYDITENARLGATYRSEFGSDSLPTQTFGLGASYGF